MMRVNHFRRLGLILTISAGVLAACGGSDGSNGGSGGAAGTPQETGTSQEAAVQIKGFEFKPDTLEVADGATVQVTNADDAAHTLTADDKSFDTGNLEGGKGGSVTVKGSGTVSYHCAIHPYMKGAFKVS